jgi:hypothetical protein
MTDGVLLVRRVGDRLEAIDVPGAIAWPTAAARDVENFLDRLLGPRPAPRHDDRAGTGTDGETP